MYSLIHSYPLRTVLTEHLPTLVVAFFIAELFYKFGSFATECLAFLLTWYLLDGALRLALKKPNKNASEER